MTGRSRFRQYFSVEEAERLITDLWDLALRVDDADDIPTVTRDPDDDYMIALVRGAEADVLVTGDRDLLDLQLSRRSLPASSSNDSTRVTSRSRSDRSAPTRPCSTDPADPDVQRARPHRYRAGALASID